MLTAKFFSAKGEPGKALELPADPFDGVVNEAALHQAVKAYLANQRQGTAATRTRGMVAGGNRKIWRQKGTGRARQGSIRAPHWKGGGTVFGPQPRDYGYAFPKKMAKGALRDALTQKLRDGAVVVVQAFEVPEVKTAVAARMLRQLGHTRKSLLIDVQPSDDFVLSTRNIPGVRLVPANRVTARDVMDSPRIIASQAALERLQEALG